MHHLRAAPQARARRDVVPDAVRGQLRAAPSRIVSHSARRVAETVYGFKTLIEEGSGRVLGAHVVGPHADEVINLFGLAVRHGLTTDDLKETIFAYPTGASDIGFML
jgi:pyruvate/2-oxoglutarate dehydrogenase complex dihydrolipoamide dehydrogenase (E3) component